MARTHEKVRFLPKGKQKHTAASAAKGVEDVLRILEGRWKLVILFHLSHDALRACPSNFSRAALMVDQCSCSQVTSPRTGCMNCLPSGVRAYSTRGGTSA